MGTIICESDRNMIGGDDLNLVDKSDVLQSWQCSGSDECRRETIDNDSDRPSAPAKFVGQREQANALALHCNADSQSLRGPRDTIRENTIDHTRRRYGIRL